MDILQCILPCNISALASTLCSADSVSRAYLKNHSRNLHILLCEKHFSNALKKELYFRNFKCVSISEIHLNHEI